MSKKLIWALLLIGLTVVVLIFNTDKKASVDLINYSITYSRAVIYLGFTAVGVVIGLLLK